MLKRKQKFHISTYFIAGIVTLSLLANQDKELKKQLQKLMIMLFLTFLGVIFITIAVARIFTSRLDKSIKSFSHFFEKASKDAKKIDLSNIYFFEFEKMANSANQMIDEQQKANQTLRESFEWIQGILNTTQSGIVVIDVEKQEVADVNPAACEMIGLPKEDIIGSNCHDFICPAEIELCPIIDLEQEIGLEERTLLRSDGTELSILKTVIKTEMSGKTYLIESFQDLSKQKKLEAQLQQTQKMEGIGALAGGIAHDFNNILSPIMMYAEMSMEELSQDDPLQTSMREIYKASIRARDLVKQILTFARKGTENRIVLRTSLIVNEAIKFLRSTIPTTIDIQYEFDGKQDTIFADPTQINQIVMNLCTNAAHSMRDKGGLIEVILDEEDIRPNEKRGINGLKPGRYVRLTVRDTGTGISPEIIDNIFEPYYTTKATGEGTGLGLAIIHGIVKNYGGDITVKSKVGKGTNFQIYLPLIDEIIPVQDKNKNDLPKGTEHIFLVDDEPVAVEAMGKMLERLGYKITTRTRSSMALEAFRHNPEAFDLIITDMTMPNMTGKELAKEIKKLCEDIPIILCTGFSDQIDEKKAATMGIGTFIMKPIEMSEMARTIRKVLDKII